MAIGSFKQINGDRMPTDRDYYREIERGFYERFKVSNASGRPSWATSSGSSNAGTNIQSHTFWRDLQQAVSTLVENTHNCHFLDPRKHASGNPIDHWYELSGSTKFYTLNSGATVWKIVNYTIFGKEKSGPRRRTSAGWWYFGLAQEGDIIGPWLLEDLQKALRYVRYTVPYMDFPEGSYPADPICWVLDNRGDVYKDYYDSPYWAWPGSPNQNNSYYDEAVDEFNNTAGDMTLTASDILGLPGINEHIWLAGRAKFGAAVWASGYGAPRQIFCEVEIHMRDFELDESVSLWTGIGHRAAIFGYLVEEEGAWGDPFYGWQTGLGKNRFGLVGTEPNSFRRDATLQIDGETLGDMMDNTTWDNDFPVNYNAIPNNNYEDDTYLLKRSWGYKHFRVVLTWNFSNK